jgi:hypothetical protein
MNCSHCVQEFYFTDLIYEINLHRKKRQNSSCNRLWKHIEL